MSTAFNLSIAPVRQMPVRDEIAVLEAALAANRDSAAVRVRLAVLHSRCDRFDRTIALLDAALLPHPGHQTAMLLAHALFARQAAGDNARARDAAAQALAVAATPRESADALAAIAKAEFRAHRSADAVTLLERALVEYPSHSAAFRRLTRHWLGTGDPARVLALADQRWSAGDRRTQLLATRALALARIGRIAEVRDELGLDRYLASVALPLPAGWNDMGAFNAQLARELLANPDLRFGRHGTTSHRSFRVDTPLLGHVPAVGALVDALVHTIAAHVGSLPSVGNRWLEARPAAASFNCWAVNAEPDGFEEWHHHPAGWLSGGYYVDMPEAVAQGDDEAGCIAFGLPPHLIGEEAVLALGEALLRPLPGSLILFPSHAFHRTFAHGAPGRRICFAFDVVPA